MEEKLEKGYQLQITKDLNTKKSTGLYIRQQNGSTTTTKTKENELDFLRILPTISEYINAGEILVLGKVENRFYGYLTKDVNQEIKRYETLNHYFLNTLVDMEEKVQKAENESKKLGGK